MRARVCEQLDIEIKEYFLTIIGHNKVDINRL